MSKIRVIPSLLLEAANELQRIISDVEAVGDQVQTATSRAPSYEGQFGPKVNSLGSEATVRSRKLAQDLSTLANVLRNKGEDFESADLAGVENLAGILAKFEAWLSSDRLLVLDNFPLDFVTEILFLGNLISTDGGGSKDEEPEWERPWWAPISVSLAEGWNRATEGAQGLFHLSIYALLRASGAAEDLTKIGLHRVSRVSNPVAHEVESDENSSVSGGVSSGLFTLGAPIHPYIYHDNGFLDYFGRESPTHEDYLSLLEWRARLAAAEIFRPGLQDASEAYRHFLDGGGVDRNFSYDRYVENDPSGAMTFENAIRETQIHTEALCASKSECSITSQAYYGGGDDARFPYPQTENWQKTIGAHAFWISADIEQEIIGADKMYTMTFVLHAEDRYNFNPGMQDIATGIPDSVNGRFEITGLAHPYMNYSTLTRTVTWVEGQYDTTVIIEGE